MLLEAAKATVHVGTQPEPFVLQTALLDYLGALLDGWRWRDSRTRRRLPPLSIRPLGTGVETRRLAPRDCDRIASDMNPAGWNSYPDVSPWTTTFSWLF